MFSRRLKNGYFVLEGVNSFATVYYFYYFYFYMQREFGFGNQANLLLAALNGATYAVCAWWAGRYAQRRGYFRALKLGFGIMLGSFVVGSQLHSAAGHIAVMLSAVAGMSFTWPTLEALVSGGEKGAGLQQMVGMYNVVWAATASVSSFIGGALLQWFGMQSLLYIPMGIYLFEFTLASWLESRAGRAAAPAAVEPDGAANVPEPPHPPRPAQAGRFLSMAWLANPFAYIGINTLIAVMPGLTRRLELSTMLAGFCSSAWCFSRFGAFILLWRWSGWHYRFRWLLLAYVLLVSSFVTALLAPSVAVLVGAELLFGTAVGLLYYSSLYYSMDASDDQGEHGGIHEAVIGLGNFAGPAVGAAALQFLPQYPGSGALAVTFLLLCGLGGLGAIWRRGRGP